MKLAEEMKKLSKEAVLNNDEFWKLYKKALGVIENGATRGANYVVIKEGKLNGKGEYWECLKDFLVETDGFKAEVSHIVAPWEEYYISVWW